MDQVAIGRWSPCTALLQHECCTPALSPHRVTTSRYHASPTPVGLLSEPEGSNLEALRRHDLAAEIFHLKEPQKVPLILDTSEAARLLAMAGPLA